MASRRTLAALVERLPPARSIVYAYLATLLPVQLWAIYIALHELPAWALQMTAWDVLGAVSYTQAFALLESILVFVPLLSLSAVLPRHWYRDSFVAVSAVVVYVSVAWFAFAQLHNDTLHVWGIRQYLPWVGLYGASTLVLAAVIRRSRRARELIEAFVDRATLLAGACLLLALVAVGVVVVRNI